MDTRASRGSNQNSRFFFKSGTTQKLATCISIILLSTLASSPALAWGKSDKNLISVTGEAKLHTMPDIVNVSMTVEIRDKNLEVAQKKNDEITEKVLNIITRNLRIDEKYVQTNYINVRPVYQYQNCGNQRCPNPTFTHFETKKGIYVELQNAEQLQELLDRSIEAGVTRIDSVNFTTSKMDQLKAKAQVMAAKDAQVKAAAIASSLGVEIGAPHRITVDYSPIRPQGRMSVMAMEAAPAETKSTIALGRIEITSQVNAEFEIVE